MFLLFDDDDDDDEVDDGLMQTKHSGLSTDIFIWEYDGSVDISKSNLRL